MGTLGGKGLSGSVAIVKSDNLALLYGQKLLTVSAINHRMNVI